MDISNLPSELVLKIAKYLSLQDLIACSWMNSKWRNVFDNDDIWKTYCTFHPKYFQNQEAKLKHASQKLVSNYRSRENYFNEQLVGKNLKIGRYHVEDIGVLYCDNLVDSVDDAGNHWLFLSCTDNFEVEVHHQIMVWNMNAKPLLHSSVKTVIGKTPNIIDSKMKLMQNKIYYIPDDATVLVFDFTHPKYQLTYLYKVSLPLPAEGPKPITAMVCKERFIFGFMFTVRPLQDPRGLYNLTEAPTVHVWDDEGNLGAEISSPVEGSPYSSRVCPSVGIKDGGSDNVLVVYQFNKLEIPCVSAFLFNVKALQYTNSFFGKPNIKLISYEIVNEVVFLLYELLNKTLELKCFTTDGNCVFFTSNIHSKFRRENTVYKLLTDNEGKQVLILKSTGYVTVYDVFSQKLVSSFDLDSQNDLNGTVLNNTYMIIRYRNALNIIYEVWNYKLGKRIYQLKELQDLGFEENSYSFSSLKRYSSPPKLFAIKNPKTDCSPRQVGQIVIVSFW